MYMIRKQLYLEERHERMLKQRAAEQGLSEAELVRRALDLLLSRGPGGEAVPSSRRDALEELLARADAAAAEADNQAWRFDRDEVYAEREARLAR